MIFVQWDDGIATSRGSENRGPTDFIRFTCYDAEGGDEGPFGNLIGKRGLMWLDGDIDPDQFKGKTMEILAHLRDEVQVIGSTQVSLTLSNVKIVRPIEGEEAKEAFKKIMLAQNKNLVARGPRQVVRNAATGNVSAQSEVASMLQQVLEDPNDARRAAAALLNSPDLSDVAAAGAAEIMLHTASGLMHLPTQTVGTPGYQPPIGEVRQTGDQVVGGHVHVGATQYRHQEGVTRRPVTVAPSFGTVGGADILDAPGVELSPRYEIPGTDLTNP